MTSILIQPIQRIPRYLLLLSDLLKHTDTQHLDHNSLQEAGEFVKHKLEDINESKRAHENREKLKSIQASLTGEVVKNIVHPGRKFMKEGLLMERVKKDKKDVKERYIFLFSDMILHTKKKKNQYEFKKFTNVAASDLLVENSGKDLPQNSFLIGDVLFVAENDIEKEQWCMAIKDVLNTLQSAHSENAAILNKSDSPTTARQTPMVRTSSDNLKKMVQVSSATKVGSPPGPKTLTSSTLAQLPMSSSSLDSAALSFNRTMNQYEKLPASIQGEWKEAFTSDGRKYYYHTKTRQTSWEKPSS
jgi:hypothetical protein